VSMPKASPMPSPSMKLCAESPAAPRTPTRALRAGLLGLVAVMQNEDAFGEEEGQEADPDEQRHALFVADGLDRLGQDVEERHRDHDSARERDQRVQVAVQAKRDQPADERREHGQSGERNRDPGHGGQRTYPNPDRNNPRRRVRLNA
jgi:hypothetical protein